MHTTSRVSLQVRENLKITRFSVITNKASYVRTTIYY